MSPLKLTVPAPYLEMQQIGCNISDEIKRFLAHLETLIGNRSSFGNYSAAADALVNPTLQFRHGACREPVCFTSIKIKPRQLLVSY